MLIRSQDKSHIVKMDNVVIRATRKEVICYAASDIESNSYIPLGYYGTEEKNFKVLDMIEGAYAKVEFAKAIVSEMAKALGRASAEIDDELAKSASEALVKMMCFQMPADNEVEV